MSIPKVIGSENEYSIYAKVSRGMSSAGDIENLAASTMVREYPGSLKKGIIDLDDFRQNQEITDITAAIKYRHNRPILSKDEKSDSEKFDHFQRSGFSGEFLPNGSRFYVDMWHPEHSTPECLNPRDLVIWEKAGEHIVDESRRRASVVLGYEILIFKKNSDRLGHSYAAHENYLVTPMIFGDLVYGGHNSEIQKIFTAFLVTRQIFAGSGKVGMEADDDTNSSERLASRQRDLFVDWDEDENEPKINIGKRPERLPVNFQISQRSDFISRTTSHDTTSDRAIINRRDRSYADEQRFRRLHLILGDANMSEWSLFLKFGTTSIMLMMLEDDVFDFSFPYALRDPVDALHQISYDPTCKKKVECGQGKFASAVEIQECFFEMAERWYKEKYLSYNPASPDIEDVLEKWRFTLAKLKENPRLLKYHLDWVIKLDLLENLLKKHNSDWDDINKGKTVKTEDSNHSLSDYLKSVDFQYHDIRPERGLYYRLLKSGRLNRIVTDEEIEWAVSNPPSTTRAWLRTGLLRKFTDYVRTISWDQITVQDPQLGIVTINLANPLWGTKKQTEKILNESKNLTDFLIKFH